MLFHADDVQDFCLPQHRQAALCPAAEPPEHTHTLVGRVSDAVDAVWPPLEAGHSYHYASAGLWSMHDLLFHLLRQTGPADVWIATWSMTEDAVRMLVQGLEAGVIRRLRLLIDGRVTRRNPSAYAFVKAHAEKTAVSVCHAKVTVIRNEAWSMAVNGSPNYTNNPRIESGVVTVSPLVAQFHIGWIEAEMSKAKPFNP
ncbi:MULTISPECIES: hypothetical protein [Spirosoma]|uniref:Phospholipase D-like domain-containing protein n=1 Tax=Spirosoma sordidisoli TaxID=2502893 RepID=A0A4Q2UJW2_9BACT|nr:MULTISPECIES: hypothetical protein [Spirosoma]RYC69793.1 hypothetical protein EQG79_14455 [Spirosoma sordidisoli]